MIPEIEEILRMLAAGQCTQEQALQWIGSHIDLAQQDQTLRDHFACTAAIGRNADGAISDDSAAAVMGCLPYDVPRYGSESTPEGRAKVFEWWCEAEARIRYAKAEGMMKARIL